ncbi:hypothetical protein D3C86_2018930 [compost metagenome]
MKRCCCSCLIGITNDLDIILWRTASIFLLVDVAVTLDVHNNLLGQGIYNGNPYTVQTA